jgi:hypothetical protein
MSSSSPQLTLILHKQEKKKEKEEKMDQKYRVGLFDGSVLNLRITVCVRRVKSEEREVKYQEGGMCDELGLSVLMWLLEHCRSERERILTSAQDWSWSSHS